jgi:hypothetical protein
MAQKQDQLRLAVGLFISLAVLAALIWFIDGREVLAAIKQVSLIWIFPVLILLLISLLTRAGAWRVILQERISLWRSFLIINAGYFVNTILPFRIGEITRAFLLLPSGFSFWEAFPTIILERMFDILFAVGLFLTGLPYALGFAQGSVYAFIMGGLVLIGLMSLVLLVRHQGPVFSWLERISVPWVDKKEWLIEKLRFMVSGLMILNRPNLILKTIIGMILSWGITLVYHFILLRAFLPEAQLIWAVFALGALALGVSIPSSPGNIGIYEASMTVALSAFGVDQSLAFTYALTSHVLSLGITTVFGAFALVNQGYALGDIWRFSIKQKKG